MDVALSLLREDRSHSMIRLTAESPAKLPTDVSEVAVLETQDPHKSFDPSNATPAKQIGAGLARSVGSPEGAGSSLVAIRGGQSELALDSAPADLRTRAEARIEQGYSTSDWKMHETPSKALRHEQANIDAYNKRAEAYNAVERLLPTATSPAFSYGGVYVQHSPEAINAYVAALRALVEKTAGKEAAERFDRDPRTSLPLQHDESGPLKDMLDRLSRLNRETSTEWGQPFLAEHRPPASVRPVEASSMPDGTKLLLTPKSALDASKVTELKFKSSDGSLSSDREHAIEIEMQLIRAEDAGGLLEKPRFAGPGASFQHPVEAVNAFRSAVLGLAKDILGDEAARRVSVGERFSSDRDAVLPPFLHNLLDRLARIDPYGREWPHALSNN
jgi:hypothetical protein